MLGLLIGSDFPLDAQLGPVYAGGMPVSNPFAVCGMSGNSDQVQTAIPQFRELYVRRSRERHQ